MVPAEASGLLVETFSIFGVLYRVYIFSCPFTRQIKYDEDKKLG